MIGCSTISGLRGALPQGTRSVTPVPKDLLALVPKPKYVTVQVKATGTDPERDTVPLIKKKIRKTVHQVDKLASKLKGSSVYNTVKNDWDFIFSHIQYKQDPDDIEAVRDPNRLIYDGKGDCDCFTVCLGAMLQAQRIPFRIRIAAYETSSEWNHVYIAVPDGKNEIILDPVMHTFNSESPYINKKDFDMKLVSLEGPVGQASQGCQSAEDQSKMLNRYIDTEQVILWGMIPTQQFLEENEIPYFQETNEETASSDFIINTPGGEMKIPSIIRPDQADRIKELLASAGAQAQAAAAELSKNFKWWWVVAGAIGIWILFGGDSNNKSKPPVNGPALNGPRPAKKKKRLAKKLAVVNI